MGLEIKQKIESTVEEFGFYIFISFSTFVISIFEAFIPQRYIFSGMIQEGVKLESIISKRLTDIVYIKKVFLENRLILFFIILMAGLIFLGSVLFFVYIYLRLTGKDPIKSPLSFPYPHWNLKDLVKIIVWIFFYIQLFSVVITMTEFFLKNRQDRFFFLISFLNSMLLDVIVLLILIYWLKVRCGQNSKALGFSILNFKKNIFLGFVSYFTFFPVLFGLIQLSTRFMNFKGISVSPQPVLIFLLLEKNPYILFILFIFIAVIGPIVEEVLFRGLLYTTLKKAVGVYQAIFISAIIFSLLHMSFMGFLPIFGLGVLFAYLYEKSGSLIPSITIHILHNSVMLCFLLIMKYIATV
jgi:hypothetical protein